MKRIYLLIALCAFCFFVTDLISFNIYDKMPIGISLLLALVTALLMIFVLTNTSSFSEISSTYKATRHISLLWALFITLTIVTLVISFFSYLDGYADRAEADFKAHHQTTRGLLIDYYERYEKGKYGDNRSVYIKVAYLANGKPILLSRKTFQLFGYEMPQVGDSIIIYYADRDAEIFKTEWEYYNNSVIN